MTAKQIKSAPLEKHAAENYMKRAMELLESMRNNIIVENWNAAVIDGVQAAISASDAVTVASIGKRCTSSQHLDAVELLKQAAPSLTSSDISRLRRIISIKSHVEYGPSLVTPKEANGLIQDVERFIDSINTVFKRII